MNNDKFGYLGNSGLIKAGVSKAADTAARSVNVKGHTRAPRGSGFASPTYSPNAGAPNPAMTGKTAAAPMNNERNPGAATAASRVKGGPKANTANIEGNESSRYEALEKKTTKSLKHGGNEKELRAGHNMVTEPGGGMQTPKQKPRSLVREAKLSGGDVKAAKAGRREAFKEFGAAKTAFKKEGYGGGRSAALKEARSNLKQNYSGAMKKYQTEQKKKADSGGGFFSKVAGAFGKSLGVDKMGGVAKKAVGLGKKSIGADKL